MNTSVCESMLCIQLLGILVLLMSVGLKCLLLSNELLSSTTLKNGLLISICDLMAQAVHRVGNILWKEAIVF